MRALIIGHEEKEKLAALKKHAEQNEMSMDDMLDLMSGAVSPAGDRPGFSCIIPTDFRVVFTVEAQPRGRARHVSISVPEENKVPSPESCDLIMMHLGFKKSLLDMMKKGLAAKALGQDEVWEKATAGFHVYIEKDKAINVIEIIDGK